MNLQALIQNYKTIMTAKYATFSGRADRPEFWYYQLTYMVLYILLAIVDGVLGTMGILTAVFALGSIVPALAVGARRLHDTDRSGWWQLIVLIPLVGIIVLIVFFCQKGTDGPNRFNA